LIRCDVLAPEPDRRAHGAVALDGVARPIAGRIVQIEPAGERHRHGLAAELAGEELRHRLHRFVIAGTAMQQKDTDLVAVGAARDLRCVGGFVDHDAHIPVEPERVDAEDVFGLRDRHVGLRQHGIGAGDGIFTRDAFRWLPVAGLG
jgi:hypothetical protein